MTRQKWEYQNNGSIKFIWGARLFNGFDLQSNKHSEYPVHSLIVIIIIIFWKSSLLSLLMIISKSLLRFYICFIRLYVECHSKYVQKNKNELLNVACVLFDFLPKQKDREKKSVINSQIAVLYFTAIIISGMIQKAFIFSHQKSINCFGWILMLFIE